MKPIRRRMLEAGKELGMTTEEIDKLVKAWLPVQVVCPWPYIDDREHEICEAMFPSFHWFGSCSQCPCDQFGRAYVRKRAREALEG